MTLATDEKRWMSFGEKIADIQETLVGIETKTRATTHLSASETAESVQLSSFGMSEKVTSLTSLVFSIPQQEIQNVKQVLLASLGLCDPTSYGRRTERPPDVATLTLHAPRS